MIAAVLCLWSAWACGPTAGDGGTARLRDCGTCGRTPAASSASRASSRFAPTRVLLAPTQPAFAPEVMTARSLRTPGRPQSRRPAVSQSAVRRLGTAAAHPPAGGEDPWFAEDKLKHVRISLTRPTQLFAQQRQEQDNWIAEDKLKHLLLSYSATVFGSAGLRAAGFAHRPALVVGAGIGMSLGIWKEIRDSRTGGDVSWKDLVADGAGVALAGLLGSHIE